MSVEQLFVSGANKSRPCGDGALRRTKGGGHSSDLKTSSSYAQA